MVPCNGEWLIVLGRASALAGAFFVWLCRVLGIMKSLRGINRYPLYIYITVHSGYTGIENPPIFVRYNQNSGDRIQESAPEQSRLRSG